MVGIETTESSTMLVLGRGGGGGGGGGCCVRLRVSAFASCQPKNFQTLRGYIHASKTLQTVPIIRMQI